MSRLQKIIFQGKEYFLVGEEKEKEGAIATREQYMNGWESYAHLFPKGVMRHKEKIGEYQDVIFTGVYEEVEPTTEGRANIISAFLNGGF